MGPFCIALIVALTTWRFGAPGWAAWLGFWIMAALLVGNVNTQAIVQACVRALKVDGD